jgi:hypothetical protein
MGGVWAYKRLKNKLIDIAFEIDFFLQDFLYNNNKAR